jgi:hypothetical protein
VTKLWIPIRFLSIHFDKNPSFHAVLPCQAFMLLTNIKIRAEIYLKTCNHVDHEFLIHDFNSKTYFGLPNWLCPKIAALHLDWKDHARHSFILNFIWDPTFVLDLWRWMVDWLVIVYWMLIVIRHRSKKLENKLSSENTIFDSRRANFVWSSIVLLIFICDGKQDKHDNR